MDYNSLGNTVSQCNGRAVEEAVKITQNWYKTLTQSGIYLYAAVCFIMTLDQLNFFFLSTTLGVYIMPWYSFQTHHSWHPPLV
jgi:hypothetical protein